MYYKKTLFIILPIFFLCVFCIYNTAAMDGELNSLIEKYHTLFREAQAEGRDVSTAMEINSRSREISRKDTEKAKELLLEAIGLLENKLSEKDGTLVWKDYYKQQLSTGKLKKNKTLKEYLFFKKKENDSDFLYGLHVSSLDELDIDQVEDYFQICTDLGMSCIKIGVMWDKVIPVDGEPPVWRGSFQRKNILDVTTFDFDAIAKFSQLYDIPVLPAFMRSKQSERGTSPEKYAEFVLAFLKRYKKKMSIKYVEFHNEPAETNDGTGKGRKWIGTAHQLVKVNNLTYDKIKSKYPDIQVGSPGFCTGSAVEADKYSIPFFKRYFKAKPKFDFFALHDYPKNISRTQGTRIGDFVSTYHFFDTYREFLSSYGYGNKPILITEGFDDKPIKKNQMLTWDWADEDEACVLILESYIHTLSNVGKNNVIGKILSGIKTDSATSMGLIDRRTKIIRNHYFFVKYMLDMFKQYPIYSGRIAGRLNSEDYWIVEFKNIDGKKMWIAFNPLNYETSNELRPAIIKRTIKFPQRAVLEIGGSVEVELSSFSGSELINKNIRAVDDKIVLELGSAPVFIK